MKDKLFGILGGFGVIAYYIISLLVSVLPFVMIGTSFGLNLLFFGIVQFVPAASVVFWIWGLVAAINGVQDIFAIIYYVLFAVIFLPFFISIILDFVNAFSKK